MPAKKGTRRKPGARRAPPKRRAGAAAASGVLEVLAETVNEVLDEVDRLADAVVEAVGLEPKHRRPRRR